LNNLLDKNYFSKYNIKKETTMKAILQDIVSHTHNLGFLNIVKVTGDDTATKFDSMSDDRSVIMFAEAVSVHDKMVGIFGMPQLNKLKYLLDGDEYREDAKIEIITSTRNNVTVPSGLHFENKDGDFKNDYRFMNTDIINEKLKTVKFREPTWDVVVTPTLQSIQRFQFQAGANSEHVTFLVKTENGNLKFIFGDQSTHGGEFVFASGVKSKLNRAHTWPVNAVLSILKIADVNNCTLSISDAGALQITMDSGLAVYKYIVPSQA
jgi:hypothetical protein